MQKQYLTLLFNMRFIFGLIILSNIFLEARDYKILGNTSHRNTQTKKVIPSTSNQKVKCQKDRLFNIDIKGTTSIATYISTITHQCNIVMKVEADVNKLMQTIPKSKSIKQENLIGIFDILLNSYGMRYELNKHVLKISAVKPPATVLKKKVTKTPSPPSLKKTTHAAPKVYASLGNELEVLQQSCELYQKSTMISDDIKTKCQAYNKKVAKAFKVGYKLDPLANSNNISEAKLNEYLNLLRSADENREKLTSFISSKIKKARLEDNVDQYIQLIEASHVNLSSRDYAFMGKHPGKMKNDKRYVQYLANIKKEEQRKAALILEKKRVAEERRQAEKKAYRANILKKSQHALKRQSNRKVLNTSNRVPFKLKTIGNAMSSAFMLTSLSNDLIITNIIVNDGYAIYDDQAKLPVKLAYGEYIAGLANGGKKMISLIKVEVFTNKGSWVMSFQDTKYPIKVTSKGYTIVSTVPNLVISSIVVNQGNCNIGNISLPLELNTGEEAYYTTRGCSIHELYIGTNQGSWTFNP